jgi:hypothetical protein
MEKVIKILTHPLNDYTQEDWCLPEERIQGAVTAGSKHVAMVGFYNGDITKTRIT